MPGVRRRKWAIATTVLLVVLIPLHVPAGESAAAPTPPPFKQLRYDESYAYLRDPSLRSDWLDPIKFIPLRADGSWYATVGGEVRERYELFHDSQWGRGPQDSGGYFLQRYMAHVDVHFADALRVFVQLKSGLEDDRHGGPRPTDRDDLDLHQAFLDWRMPFDGVSIVLRGGRQELAYGSSRLVSFRESPNVRQSFDGVKAIVRVSTWQVDLFAVKPVRTKTDPFDDDPDPKRSFWGLYAVTPVSWLPGGAIDLYYLGIDREDAEFNQGTADELRHSLGARIWGKSSGWDYNFEFVYQTGTFGSGDIRAWTAASDTGYTFDTLLFSPRFGFKLNATSGDRDPNSRNLQTFDPLFPKGAYFGEPALVGPANHVDVHPSVDLALREDVTLTADWDCFWRESTHDGLYGPPVNLLQASGAGGAHYVGNQLELLVEWQIDRHFVFTADYAHFFAGDFLKESPPASDVDYFSTWLTYKF